MQFSRLLAAALVCACPAFAAATQPALHPKPQFKPRHFMKGQTLESPNSPRLKAARAEELAASKRIVTPTALAATSADWSPKHTLYVGCTDTNPTTTYSTIQDAVAAAGRLYTVIKVCPGTYDAGGADTGITISASYIEIEGVVKTAEAETVTCGGGDNSWGFWLLGSHNVIKNLTIVDCYYGVYSGYETEMKHNQILDNWFGGNYEAAVLEAGYATDVVGNDFLDNYYTVLDYAGVKDNISGNTVIGGDEIYYDGIALTYTVGATIKNNTISGVGAGLDFGYDDVEAAYAAKKNTVTEEYYGFNTFATVKSNNIYDTYIGISLYDNNSGNHFENNWLSDSYTGIWADNTSGAAAVPDAGTNRFESNHAVDNNTDYVDETAIYSGPDTDANATTADHWMHNKGTTASPAAILSH